MPAGHNVKVMPMNVHIVLRHGVLATVAAFLLSERSSGLNGTALVVDAGLGSNYFDKEIIRLAMRPETPNAKTQTPK